MADMDAVFTGNRTDFYKLLTKHELKPEEFKD